MKPFAVIKAAELAKHGMELPADKLPVDIKLCCSWCDGLGSVATVEGYGRPCMLCSSTGKLTVRVEA
jgi:hypothetical protein